MKVTSNQVTFTIPAEAIAKADEMAARLGSSRKEVLNSFFAALLPSFRDGINDHCLEGGYVFQTPQAAEKFLRNEKLDRRGYEVVEWADESGFGVCPMLD